MSSMINEHQTGRPGGPTTPRALSPRLVLALLLVAGSMVPGMAWGQSIKLSAGQNFSDVVQFEISPDGARVVYSHDADTDDAVELWSVPIAGGTPVRLSGLLASGVEVQRWLISPDSTRVVYEARQDNVSVSELYQVPIAGGVAPLKLNGPGVVGVRGISQFLLSPAGDRVVYTAFNGSNRDVFSVPITGGSPVKLNPTLVAGGNVDSIWVAPSGDRVVYRADQDTDEVSELYSVPIAGGGAVKLNDELVSEGDVLVAAVSPGSRVVYRADQDFDEAYNLYSVPIAGGTPIQLNGGLVSGGDVRGFALTPDGSRVIYRADQQTDELFELYSVPVGGGIVVKLTGSQPGADSASRFSVTPDSARVLYLSDTRPEDLWSAPVAGGEAPIRLNRTTVPASSVPLYRISPDSNWVVYLQRSAGWMTSTGGPAGSGVLAWGTQLDEFDFAIDPTSTQVVVAASRQGEPDPVLRLWQAPLGTLDNLIPTELVPAADFVAGGNLATDLNGAKFAIGPLGSIVYIADQDSDEVFELYAIPELGEPIFANGFE